MKECAEQPAGWVYMWMRCKWEPNLYLVPDQIYKNHQQIGFLGNIDLVGIKMFL
jgi:hypothetical protein